VPDLGEDLLSEITTPEREDGSFTNLTLGQVVVSTLSFHKHKITPPPLALKSCCAYLW